MDSKEEEMFLENIEEFVKDEGKIVTYKWLSKTLDIHVNEAKQLLHKYALKDGVKKSDVHLTYVVGGMLSDGCGAKIEVCRETELDQVRSQFKIINFEHIYSVQKIENIPDLNILYGVDQLKPEQSSEERLGAITCKRAVRRRGSDIAALRDKAIAATAVATKVPAFVSKKPAATVVKPQDVKTADVKAVSPEKPKTIASMFSAQTKKQPENNGKSPVTNAAAKKGKGGGIASFFSKQTEKPKPAEKPTKPMKVEVTSPEASNRVSKQDTVVETSSRSIKSAASDHVDKKQVSTSPAKNEATSKTPASCTNTKEGKRKKKSSDVKTDKKRKRIMVMSDSDSDDDMFGKDDDDDDDVRPPSPDIAPEEEPPVKCDSSDEDIIPATPVTVQNSSGKIRIRTRKLVDKTFMDDDGYIVTKKEMVYESCSEDEKEDTSVVKEVTKREKKRESVAVEAETEDEIVSKSKNKSKSKVPKEEEVTEVSNEKKDKEKDKSKDEDAKDKKKGESKDGTVKASKRKKKGEVSEEDAKDKKAKKKGESQDEADDVTDKKSKKQKRESKGGEGEEDSPAIVQKAKRKKKETGGESQEDEKASKKPEKKKKASPPASKGKQQTLMSFFSKK